MLRPYQDQSLDIIEANWRKGILNMLVVLSTGGGKTVIFCEILKRLHAKKLKAIMLVKGRDLVNQASKRLFREKVPHGVHMAGHWNRRPQELIQVCSVDTLTRRKLFPEADLIVLDEVHLSVSKSYRDFLKQYDDETGRLGFTATPWPDAGLGHIARTVVEPISFDELVAQGYLVAPRYFAPSLPDLTGIKTVQGDYNQVELNNKMDKNNLVGDIVTHFKKFATGRKAVCFGVSIQHSKNLAATFSANGIPAVHCDADSSDAERVQAIEDLRTGKISVLCNVGIFSLGVDIPFLDCVIMARPTKSAILYIQQVGRGTRPFEGKTDFLVLDHAGNVLRHGFANEYRPAILSPVTRNKEVVAAPITCLNCFAVFATGSCPNCGNSNPEKLRELEVKDGELREIVELTDEQKLLRYVAALKKRRKIGNGTTPYKRAWLWHELKRTHGEETANRFFKPMPEWLKKKLFTEKTA